MSYAPSVGLINLIWIYCAGVTNFGKYRIIIEGQNAHATVKPWSAGSLFDVAQMHISGSGVARVSTGCNYRTFRVLHPPIRK